MSKQEIINRIQRSLSYLSEGQALWLDRVIQIFQADHNFEIRRSDLFDDTSVSDFGDALRIHHSFSREAFTKDKFEYVLERVLNGAGLKSELADRGNPGHDITIGRQRVSLKTQADKAIKEDRIWISKFMELGRGVWTNEPDQLIGLRDAFFEHMNGYDRILTLRTLRRGPDWIYELVEIPKSLLCRAEGGRLEMKLKSRQSPKPGYCYVEDDTEKQLFQLYFDGGSERKLQIKHLMKDQCIVHARWEFNVPPM